MIRTFFATILTLLLACALFISAGKTQTANAVTTVETAEPPVVSLAQATMSEIIARASVSGTLVAAEEVLVNTRVNGYAIETIAVEVGDVVTAGAVLATLDDSGPRAQLAQAEADVLRADAAVGQARSQIDSATANQTEADASLTRNEQLRNTGNISRATLDQAKAAAASARANLASAREGLKVATAQRTASESQRNLARLTVERTKIKAPVNGIVSARNARLGEIATGSGEPLFRLIRGGEIEIAVDVVETGLGGIDVGDSAQLNVAGVGPVSGEVRLVSPTVDARSRLGSVRIALAEAGALRPGLSASGWITTDKRNALTVPASAVLAKGLESYVQVVEDGVVKTRPVVAGVLSSDGRREIIAGLDNGVNVIARAGAFFIDGDRVRSITSQAPASTGAEAVQ